MNKPASYFARLRHRKVSRKAHKRGDVLPDDDVASIAARARLRPNSGVAREPELANEF